MNSVYSRCSNKFHKNSEINFIFILCNTVGSQFLKWPMSQCFYYHGVSQYSTYDHSLQYCTFTVQRKPDRCDPHANKII